MKRNTKIYAIADDEKKLVKELRLSSNNPKIKFDKILANSNAKEYEIVYSNLLGKKIYGDDIKIIVNSKEATAKVDYINKLYVTKITF
ncbi:MAG: hypothetical protein FWC53_03530 [Firmicutes bacterium]|nr:hypothetical protein [Bacillota bacterium]